MDSQQEQTSMESTHPVQTDATTSPTMISSPAINLDPAVRFRGLGTNFKAKLIGIDDVQDSRGDQMCQQSILKLKAAVKASGQHKQKIVINVSLEGIKVVDIMTGEVQHVHPVHRISFIARDLTDRRAFGYVYGAGEGRHQFFAIKTAKVAEVLVLALRDLFQVVYDMKKKEMEEAKTLKVNGSGGKADDVYALPQKQKEQNAQPTSMTSSQQQQSNGSLLDLEKQLTNIQEGINNIDSFSPWSQDMPTSPDTPGFQQGEDGSSSDLFGIANLSDISSLSSDFSCASGAILDYSQGGDKNFTQQQFERSGSSRSAISWHGFNLGHQHVPVRSNSQVDRTRKLGPISGVVNRNNLSPVYADKEFNKSVKDSSHVEKSNGIVSEHSVTGIEQTATHVADSSQRTISSKNANENSSRSTLEKTRDTLQSSSSISSLPESDKKAKKTHAPASFFSISDKSKKNKSKKSSKKEKSKGKKNKPSARLKGSKSADEKFPASSPMAKKQFMTDSENNNTDGNDERSTIKKTTSSEFVRRDSISSVNSVQSCVVQSTAYSTSGKGLSSSRTSLEGIRKVHKDITSPAIAQKNKSNPITMDSYIVHSSICPRTRPKVKHSGRVTEAESNPHNPPMFKTHSSTSVENESNDSPEKHSGINDERHEVNEKIGEDNWVATFEAEFDSFGVVNSPIEDTQLDPFTGQEMNITSSTPAVFDDIAWGPSQSYEQESTDQDKAFDNSSNRAGSSLSDPFTESSRIGFTSDPFSSTNMSSPFDGVDPFAEVIMEDPLHDPFAPFNEKDFFTDALSENSNIPVALHNEEPLPKDSNIPESNESDSEKMQNPLITESRILDDSPRFQHEKDDHHSVESSSLTSGMSSPTTSTASPVHNTNLLPTNIVSSNSVLPPPLPPRLPPRPTKRSSPAIEDNSPKIPPPPPPEISALDEFASNFSSEELENSETSPPDFSPPDLPPDIASEIKQPPAIPKRTHSRHPSLTARLSTPQDSKIDFATGYPMIAVASEIISQSAASNGNPMKNSSSYSDELFAIDAQAVQPAPQPGAKLTKEQIMMSFGGAAGPQAPHGMFPAQQQMMMPPNQYGMHGHMGPGYAQQMQGQQTQGPATSVPFGMFPGGPSPAIPPRPGAMRPPPSHAVQGGAAQNPFGDASLGGTNSGSMLAPMNTGGNSIGGEDESGKSKSDPFSNLVSGIGGSGKTSKKDMFKNFEMAKPPQPPPRSNPPTNSTVLPSAASSNAPAASSNGLNALTTGQNEQQAPSSISEFDSYFLNTVGGVPLSDDNSKTPTPAQRTQPAAADPFGMGLSNTSEAPTDAISSDPFGGGFDQPFQFNQTNDNSQSLFG